MTNAGHPDDEQLSAHLDGEGSDGTDLHLDGCGACRARLGQLRAVAAAVGGPLPPPSADLVDAAVAAALVHFDGSTGADRRNGPPATEVIPLRRPAPATRRPPLVWLASAAAAIALLVGIPLLLDDRPDGAFTAATGRDQSQEAAKPALDAGAESGGATGEAATSAESADKGTTGGERPRPAGGADLGDQSDTTALIAAIGASQRTSADGQAAPAPPPQDYADRPGGAETALAAGSANCVAAAREAGRGRLGALVYEASARWRGTPAAVLVFGLSQPGAGDPGNQLYVMGLTGCPVLAEQQF